MSDPTGSGILLADKPTGISSHDVVARARRALGTRRIGHAGTLDPFATGLLIVLIGRATRLQRFFMALPKTYEVTARLGATSSTGDPEGEITETGIRPATPLVLPQGVIGQRPHAYSAVKVDGERAYVRARRGEAVDLAEREVEIFEFREVGRDGDTVRLHVVCSSGTYVRSLVAALGDAYCLSLRRTAIGPFTVEDAWPTQGPAELLDVAQACARFLTVHECSDVESEAIRHGRAIEAQAGDSPVLLTDARGAIAVAEQRTVRGGAVVLAPVVGLADQ